MIGLTLPTMWSDARRGEFHGLSAWPSHSTGSEHLAARELRAQQPPPPVAVGYHAADLDVLFGGLPR
ncbi:MULTISPECIES: hypothetical protein [unclassified Streptomyces]|uniref:hypothetical protein n=1 Tax=unclassified Streptomyces TaxID=2593676 RepID=UPI0033D83FAE